MSETDNQTNWPKSTRRKDELIMRTMVVFKIDAIKMSLSANQSEAVRETVNQSASLEYHFENHAEIISLI